MAPIELATSPHVGRILRQVMLAAAKSGLASLAFSGCEDNVFVLMNCISSARA